MAKSVASVVLDAALNYIKNNCVLMTACNAQPTTYAQAATTYKLADVTVATGDFTVAADSSGRKVTVAAKAAVPVDTSGDAIYVAWCSSDMLLLVTTCTLQGLVQGNTVDFPAWKYNLQDPT